MTDTSGAAVTDSARVWLHDKARAVRGWLLIATLAGLAGGWLIIAQAGVIASIVAAAISAGVNLDELLPWFAGLGGIIALRAALQWLQETAGLEAGLRVRRQTRAELLEHSARLGPVRLSAYHSAELAGQLLEHSEALHGYFARFMPQMVLAAAIPLSILLVVARLDWLAAVFLLASAPLIPLFMSLIGMGAERLNRRQFETLARLAGTFLDRVRGLATLQLFGHAERSIDEVARAADDYRRRSMRTLRVAFLSSAVLEFFAAVAIATVAIYIGFALLGFIEFGPAPQLTLFSGLFILLLAPEFFQPLRNLAQHYHDRAAALAAGDILLDLLRQPAAATPITTSNAHTAVRLTGVSVSHPGRGRVLGPLSLDIAAGQFVVIDGPSGAGKSTLLQLVAGFVSPDDGHCHRPDSFAWLDQRPFLLHGSVADNLRLAAATATDDALYAALREVGLTDWLERQPRGLATPIDERGSGISGGQAQRLALARVFLSAAPLVLLDEPSAHLDAHSEAHVLRSLQALAAQGRTLLVASHHAAVHELADRRIQLDAGQLIEGHGGHA
ncbi:thiol reductant ABC exporter subunit CydD [Methylohalomonas lacus]|uniref:thiol reductant ABC exporter subunit CydD n=1 Tax=Methylohalomonas lacus TaxID=398773 RepID=UPI00216A44E1|nr:thiol reductant ABC exporter subunit CydD [Methylohalomonas lacus]